MRGTDHDVRLKVDILTYRMAGWSRVGVCSKLSPIPRTTPYYYPGGWPTPLILLEMATTDCSDDASSNFG